MDIPQLLWGVLEKEGHGSIAEMARAKHVAYTTLYSWMTKKRSHRRVPWKPASLLTISRITGEPVERLLGISGDGRDSSG
ncbi:hypothetical protein AMK68_00240 [candidate division KD3-62 bacterium DG_56]|uniref:HTH cro/C1-type domain-containing protein n=1 Tax=candidate division KD3-62 bacterium DG_56 TaxID=1704032 RepID=A0A0S7XQW9_9BACT|nr:MAG: hypothetical protein AMK68_00240 [candidate division KD3-62 bacterium DG_56]